MDRVRLSYLSRASHVLKEDDERGDIVGSKSGRWTGHEGERYRVFRPEHDDPTGVGVVTDWQETDREPLVWLEFDGESWMFDLSSLQRVKEEDQSYD